ncbi:hypothetical protein [Natrialba aegyptia]|uniref:Uncharacterized protein n=1 Tax=Natrialba aegyptia DSM 13077 TaxID=1227491 RepID=M0B4N3_9EURY|nr:hypothetical protein [Natrialba aegyptia]ELZ05785.1 hypothetical protein C480_10320 [Natrialba aegyptia DSM 13077]
MNEATDEDVSKAVSAFEWVDADSIESVNNVPTPEWEDRINHARVETAGEMDNELVVYGEAPYSEETWIAAIGEAFVTLTDAR